MHSRKRDAMDRNLLAALEEDARISTSELARKLGVARSTVNERIARLEREGVIMGYSAIVRPELDVQETRTMLFITCNRAHWGRIVSALEEFPEIQECVTVSGNYSMACTVRTPCAEDLDALVEEIAAIPGITTVDIMIVLASKFARNAAILGSAHGSRSRANGPSCQCQSRPITEIGRQRPVELFPKMMAG